VSDDRGVDEDVERLRRQRAERWHRQAQDLAIVRAAPGRDHLPEASDL
jgi:hypothetical protein